MFAKKSYLVILNGRLCHNRRVTSTKIKPGDEIHLSQGAWERLINRIGNLPVRARIQGGFASDKKAALAIGHLADQAAMMGTYARDYFPRVPSGDFHDKVLLNRREYYGLCITPLQIGQKKWTSWLGFSLPQIWEIKKDIILLSLLVSMAASLGLGTILYIVIGHFVRPIGGLTLSAASIGNGELSPRVKIKFKGEIGQLANSFNQMAANLR